MKSFAKENVQELRADINNALAAVAAKHEICLSIGAISYRDYQFTTRITGIAGEAAMGDNVAATKYSAAVYETRWQHIFGVSPDMLGKSIVSDGKELTFVGLAPQRKCPYIFQQEGHKNRSGYPKEWGAILIAQLATEHGITHTEPAGR